MLWKELISYFPHFLEHLHQTDWKLNSKRWMKSSSEIWTGPLWADSDVPYSYTRLKSFNKERRHLCAKSECKQDLSVPRKQSQAGEHTSGQTRPKPNQIHRRGTTYPLQQSKLQCTWRPFKDAPSCGAVLYYSADLLYEEWQNISCACFSSERLFPHLLLPTPFLPREHEQN